MPISLLIVQLSEESDNIYYISPLKMLPKLVICAEDLMVGCQLGCLGQLGGQRVDPLRHTARGSIVRLNKPEKFKL
jgi:hypothetical protein